MPFNHVDADVDKKCYAIRHSKERKKLGMNELEYLDYMMNRK